MIPYKLLLIGLYILLLTACGSTSYVKRSNHAILYSPAMKRDMSYSVYTPPGWTAEESLPLMVLLHGARDSHETFDFYEVGQELDKSIAAAEAPRMIVLSPDGELGFWENWHDGSKLYRDWVVRDLMPHVRKKYNTQACPQYCYVSGISMGGHGAMRFAYYEPNTFGSAAIISAPIISKLKPAKTSIGMLLMKWFLPMKRIWGEMDGENSHVPKDFDPYISWVEKPELVNMPVLLIWGNHESRHITEGNESFQKHLEDNAKQHAWFVYEGAHKWIYWRRIMADVVRFHAEPEDYQPISPIVMGVQ